jgi:tetratricopeptide (TPR) repeat protein
MVNRKLLVFISSTVADLAAPREEVDRSLVALDIFDVIRSETLPAMEEPSRRVCLEEARSADIMVLLLGRNYGYVPSENNPEGLSVTHLEFRQARQARVPIFAFPQRVDADADRDPGLNRLMGEVEGFDTGVFRKTWTTTEQLATEVRRSLLFFLARKVRSGGSVPIDAAKVSQAVQDNIVVPLAIRSHAQGGTCRAWLIDQLPHVADRARRLALPALQLALAEPAPTDRPHLVIEVADANIAYCDVAFHLQAPNKADSTPEIRMRLKDNEVGKAACASALLALMRWTSDDRAGAVATLSDAAKVLRLSKLTRANVLAVAMWMSEGRGELVGLGERLLDLDALDEHTYVRASHALLVLRSGEDLVADEPQSQLSRRATALNIRLSEAALTTGVAGVEAVYSMAKELTHFTHEGVLRLFLHVRELEPDYDRRWYWHRDVGQLYYAAGRLRHAAFHYDRACRLKSNNGQLWRWAGDAYYARGRWDIALERYEAALRQDPYEVYLLKEKVDFCRAAIRSRRNPRSRFGEHLSTMLARIAVPMLYRWPRSRAGHFLAKMAAKLDPLDRDSRAALALAANRQGQYDLAIKWLKETLACAPERAGARLNLAANLIFRAEGRWTDEAAWQAQAAVALRGVSVGPRLSVLLTNTRTREDLLAEFEAKIIPLARRDWEAHFELRKKVLAPERFGTILHTEGPDKFPPP